MAHQLNVLPNFAGGELSPQLDARVDLPAYRKGARQIKNMIVLKTGGVTRRPGTQYIANGKGYFSSTPVQPALSRLVKFQFAPGTTFQLEFCHQAIRFYSNGAQVTVTSAPAWVSGTSYPAGSFVSYTGQIWYTPQVIINSTAAPPLSPWLLQSIYEVPAPYSAINYTAPNYWDADIFGVQVCQINDVVYITHPNFPVYKLTSYGNTNWVMQEVAFLTPAMLDQNATDTTLAASGTSGSVTLTASAPGWVTSKYYQRGNSVLEASVIYRCLVPHVSGTFSTDLANGLWTATPIFQTGHVNSYWQISYNPPPSAQLINQGITGNLTSSSIAVVGTWNLLTYGTWSATIAVQVSYDNGVSWQTVTTLTSGADANFNISGQALIPALYQLVISNWVTETSTTPPRVTFTPDNQFVYGLVQITAVANAYSATAKVITPLYATTATVFWSEGAWSDLRGYPQAVTVFQERVWYASTAYQPQRVWGTQTNDIENFALWDQSQATYGLAFDLNAPGRGPIHAINAQTDLMAYLASAEWVISSGQSSAAITPTQIIALEHSSNGSISKLPAIVIGNAEFFVQRRGTVLCQQLYSVFTAKYMSQDMLVLSSHLTKAGIKGFDYQQQWQNQSLIWMVTGDGHLLAMTYDMQQEVFSWANCTTGDGTDFGFLSVSTIYGADGADDEVWVTTLRKNQSQATIERLYPIDWQTANNGQPDITKAWYADCAFSVTSPTSNTIALPNVSALFGGRSMCVSINGAITVTNLTATPIGGGLYELIIPNYVPVVGNTDVLVIGFPINWSLQPMRIDVAGNGAPMPAITKAIFQLWLRTLNSIGGNFMTEDGVQRAIPSYPITQNSGQPPLYFPNVPQDIELPVGADSQYVEDPQITVFGSDPLPMTILGLTLKIDVGGKP